MISIAIVGAGFMARTHAEAIEKLPNASLHSVYSRSAESSALAAQFSARPANDFESLLNDDSVDAIDLCIPTDLHRSFAERALAAKKHVLIEKPLALSVDDADAIAVAATASGRTAMVAMVLRFWPAYREALRVIRSGAIGTAETLSASRLGSAPDWNSWMADPARSGGHIIDLMIHDLDFTAELFGRPHRVHATAAPGVAHAFVTTEHDGAIASHEGSWAMSPTQPLQSRLRVVGTQGVLEHRFTPGDESLTVFPHSGEPQTIPFIDTNPYEAELAYFIDCIENAREPDRSSIAIGRDALELALAASRASAR